MNWRYITPWVLIVLRVLGGPLIVLGARRDWPGGCLGTIVVLALLSDIYDGVLARRWGCETSTLRLSDSVADTIFYLGVVCALWLREPGTLFNNWQLFVILFTLEAFRYLFDFWKFHKAASYHSYLAKAWGLLIAVSMVAVMSFQQFHLLIPVALLFGILVNFEGLTMSFILPKWKNDVKTLQRAWVLRQEMLSRSE